LREKNEVWVEISEIRKNQHDRAWCVVGDFNSTRCKEERRSVISIFYYSREIRGFNDFIEKTDLVDIPMVRRKFTSYKPNGAIKSITDKIWCSRSDVS